MSLPYEDVFPVLARAVTGFEPTEQDWVEPLPYCFINEMVRFVCDWIWVDSAAAKDFSVLLEKLITEGEDEVQYLVADALEGLLDRENKEIVAAHFGPLARRRWEILSGRSEWPQDVPHDWAKFPK